MYFSLQFANPFLTHAKRKIQVCSSNHMCIVSWRHVLDYMIRLIKHISNSEIVLKIAKSNSLFLCVINAIVMGVF